MRDLTEAIPLQGIIDEKVYEDIGNGRAAAGEVIVVVAFLGRESRRTFELSHYGKHDILYRSVDLGTVMIK